VERGNESAPTCCSKIGLTQILPTSRAVTGVLPLCYHSVTFDASRNDKYVKMALASEYHCIESVYRYICFIN
jgi:hypothetical protein